MSYGMGKPIMQTSSLPEVAAFKCYRIFTAPDDGYYEILDVSYYGGDSNEYFTVGLFPPTTAAEGVGPTQIAGGVYFAYFAKIKGNIHNSENKLGSMYQGYNLGQSEAAPGFMRKVPPGWSLWIWAIDGTTNAEVITHTLAAKCAELTY
tara:strand:+ start:472 stop:918 length:447 start_codon:yes stop_codon:yes gene_type:complete